ncbi:MAG: hypothetical protein HY912_15075 [Desulfomonile tiedjei]|uniref:Uncharacterized protein n=1 Tax=Desulfomonile tiedjei TaxID=2358 RepID=A0A9D6V6E3_9BACT|nr:hypothetical protein [Desulfomonile tiedjei]
MTRGKDFFRTTEFSTAMPHETVVDPHIGNTICSFDAGTTWFTESHSSAHGCSDCETSQARPGDAVSEEEVLGLQRAKQVVPKLPANSRISSLKKTKIKLRGKISELFSSRIHKTEVGPETQGTPAQKLELDVAPHEIPQEIASPEPVIQAIEDMEVRSPDVSVQVVPTPVKRRRAPKIELAPKPAKPLKIIRRRREEAPKVFETSPKNFPKSMLQGIKAGLEEERDFPQE